MTAPALYAPRLCFRIPFAPTGVDGGGIVIRHSLLKYYVFGKSYFYI